MIDVTKCIGCRKGVGVFTEKDGKYVHIDLFATPAAGASYKCGNSDVIGKHLVQHGNLGTLLANEDLESFYEKQSFWWEDIIDLAYEVLKEQDKVSSFFNDGKKDDKMWNKPNVDIENALIALAEKEGMIVDEDRYPDFTRWQ